MPNIDLNDREFSDIKERVPFLPRTGAQYVVQPLDFGTFTTDTSAGWFTEFEILEATPSGVQSEEAPAVVGGIYRRNFQSIAKDAWKKKADMQVMRLFLAAVVGVSHSKDFDANDALSKLEKLGKNISKLKPFRLEVESYYGKKTNEATGKPYVNTNEHYHPASK